MEFVVFSQLDFYLITFFFIFFSFSPLFCFNFLYGVEIANRKWVIEFLTSHSYPCREKIFWGTYESVKYANSGNEVNKYCHKDLGRY